MSEHMTATDPVSEVRELLSAANGLTDPGTPEIPTDALDWMVSAHRLLAALADEVERLRDEPTEAEIEAAAEAITAHSTLSHPCEGGERCCDECGEAFGWHGIDRTEEDHRYALHRARKALAAAQEARSHDHHGPRGGR